MSRPQKLFPNIEPFRSDLLSVTCSHKIYFEQCGNPKGFPVLFVHGGPGAGCNVKDRSFFDPNKWCITLFDQRGCGRSKPLGKLAANNTWALVDDIQTLCKKLGIKRFVSFGGSWGSTLATIFAIEYPKMIAGLVLRGIYLATKRELDYFYNDGLTGVGIYVPEQWERYISHVPLERRNDPFSYYNEQIAKGDRNLARELAIFECSTLHLATQTEKEIEKDADSAPEMGLLEAHYFRNNCFIEEGYILENAASIPKTTPTVIVHGKYDLVCMPLSAKLLHDAIPHSELHWTIAGHSSKDPETLKKLVLETDVMFDKIRK